MDNLFIQQIVFVLRITAERQSVLTLDFRINLAEGAVYLYEWGVPALTAGL